MLGKIMMDRYPPVPDIIDIYKDSKHTEFKNKTLDIYSVVYYNIRWTIIILALTSIFIKKSKRLFKYIYGLLALVLISNLFLRYKLDLFFLDCIMKENNIDTIDMSLRSYFKYFIFILLYLILPILLILKVEPEGTPDLNQSSGQDSNQLT